MSALFDLVKGSIILFVVLFIGLVPNFLFQYLGWADNKDLDLLSRAIGFIIVLLIFCYFTSDERRKR